MKTSSIVALKPFCATGPPDVKKFYDVHFFIEMASITLGWIAHENIIYYRTETCLCYRPTNVVFKTFYDIPFFFRGLLLLSRIIRSCKHPLSSH